MPSAPALPARGVQDLVGLVDVELELQVVAAEARRVVQEVGRGHAGAAVDEVLTLLRSTSRAIASRTALSLEGRVLAA
jgi:hypothetical protein